MGVNAGVRVIATTRDRDRFSIPDKLGAERCEIERRDLSKHIAEAKKIDRVLDLVGNSVMPTPSPCFAAAAAPVLPAGLAVSIRSPTSTRCCKWREVSI
jgi:hypothetical protein